MIGPNGLVTKHVDVLITNRITDYSDTQTPNQPGSKSIHFPGSREPRPLVLKPALYYSQTLPPMTLTDQNSLAVPLPKHDHDHGSG
jgi:hypothetical protein